MSWWIAAIGGAGVCALGGWALITALALVSHLAATGAASGSELRFATQVWLLAHGGVLQSGGVRITLVPLVITALVALGLHGVASYAGKQMRLSSGADREPGLGVLAVTGTLTGSYVVVVTIASLVTDPSSLRAAVGAGALAAVMGFVGARRGMKWDFFHAWPVWSRAVPRAIGASVLVALVGGVVVFLAGLISHRDQIVSMTEQLHPGWAGGIVLVLVQLCYALTIVVWSMSWSFGPGFTLGDGSVVSLMGSHVGLLPAFPVTAALPSGTTSLGTLGWLIFPVAAGATSALMVLRARPRARFDETALVGGLSGVLSGFAVVALAGVTRGSLGVSRLADIGPLLTPLLIIAPCLMGLAGAVTGLIAGLVRRPVGDADPRWWARWGAESADAGPADQETVGIRGIPLGGSDRTFSAMRTVDPPGQRGVPVAESGDTTRVVRPGGSAGRDESTVPAGPRPEGGPRRDATTIDPDMGGESSQTVVVPGPRGGHGQTNVVPGPRGESSQTVVVPGHGSPRSATTGDPAPRKGETTTLTAVLARMSARPAPEPTHDDAGMDETRTPEAGGAGRTPETPARPGLSAKLAGFLERARHAKGRVSSDAASSTPVATAGEETTSNEPTERAPRDGAEQTRTTAHADPKGTDPAEPTQRVVPQDEQPAIDFHASER